MRIERNGIALTKKLVIGACAASTIVLIGAAPVQAQYGVFIADVIGQTVANMGQQSAASACMHGTPNSDAEIEEARIPSSETIAGVVAASRAGEPLAPWFLDRDPQLVVSEQTVPLTDVGPLLDEEINVSSEPLRFYRSGMHALAVGQWHGADPDGENPAILTGYFKRKSGEWKLQRLSVAQGDELVEPVGQFCNEPGDVIEHRLTSAASQREYAGRQIEKAERRLARSRERLAETRQKIADRGSSAGRLRQLQQHQRSVEDWERKLAQREEMLASATESETEAMADAAELKRLTLPVGEAPLQWAAADAAAEAADEMTDQGS